MLVLYQPGPAGRPRTSSLSCGMEPTDVTLIDAAVREPVEEADVDPGQAFPTSYTPIYIEHEPVPARPAKNEPEHGASRPGCAKVLSAQTAGCFMAGIGRRRSCSLEHATPGECVPIRPCAKALPLGPSGNGGSHQLP